MASMQKRLQKELLALQNDPPPGMTLNEKSVQNTITQWIVDMEGAPGTLYEGEKFQLLFKFSSRYPFDSPQVMFTGDNIPVHPHIYSNGHICLSILTEDWSPALSVQSVCLSIISMLSSCKEKRRPPDNSFYVRTCNKNPKKTKWWYHGIHAQNEQYGWWYCHAGGSCQDEPAGRVPHEGGGCLPCNAQ
ncbi:ubiquitin-conjugating enzyme E2 W isoform X1 [Myxocyprinus asiaticus]|uniref:ubiquitin-conjugating enzyme E2 W isoform X1 n=1 Tax=Myxocyprinus asiaticus TaxID=70543 RepID=UPI002222B3E7|nr:ubiquitin-conjugating enzyme E2 W isoform X1 [Myxocyprinus asiaticus]